MRCGHPPSLTSPSRAANVVLLIPSLLSLGLMGCSASGGVAGPDLSPAAAAAQAMTAYDSNNDGSLDSKELDGCLALKSALARIDTNGDSRIGKDEIEARLDLFKKVGLLRGVQVDVTLDGVPLAGATITFLPEKFLGASYKPALGTTDESGTAMMQIEGTNELSMAVGYYRIEVSRKDGKGQEMVPVKYNTKSTLGREIAPDTDGRSGGPITLPLTRK